ncbi:hypothetical protein TMRO357_01045 [Alteriqipengyuania sp. 357]
MRRPLREGRGVVGTMRGDEGDLHNESGALAICHYY